MSMGAKFTVQHGVQELSAFRNFPFRKEDIQKIRLAN